MNKKILCFLFLIVGFCLYAQESSSQGASSSQGTSSQSSTSAASSQGSSSSSSASQGSSSSSSESSSSSSSPSSSSQGSSGSQQDIAITSAAGGGQPLGEVSTDALIKARDYASDNGYSNEASTIQAELDRRNAAIKEAQTEAQKAENEASNALIELLKTENALSSAEDKLQKYEESGASLNDNPGYQAAVEKVEKCKEAVAEAKQNLEQKVAAATSAYQKLANIAEQYQSTGDPVKISTGEFIAEYEDFYAQDFGNAFRIKRNFSTDGFREGFGKNWTCSLSSRIIRCESKSLSSVINGLQSNMGIVQKGLSICNEYKKSFEKYPNEKIEFYYEYFLEMSKKYGYLLSQVSAKNVDNQKNQELNQYVKYGRFLDSNNYYSLNDDIVFVNEDGESFTFYYANSGLWKSYSEIIQSEVEIFSIDKNKNICSSKYGTGGFLVNYKNGNKFYYSVFGVLEEFVDSFGNKTVFNSKNGFINSITLKTGEIIYVARDSSNQIIKISGNVSGTALYTYSNKNLSSVTDNKNIKVSFSYDSSSYLTQIKKADENKIVITWQTDSSTGKKVCSSIKNENNDIENFYYDFPNKTVTHKTINGNLEKFKFNNLGNVVYRLEENGDEIFIENNSLGIITSITKNGLKRNFFYDKNFNLIKITNSDGFVSTRSYNNKNQVTKNYDFDGFSESFSYDAKGSVLQKYYCGNLISSCQYYANGLLKTLTENDCIYNYQYNKYGSITKKEFTDKDGKNYTENWTYDSQNRVVKYENCGDVCKFSYANNYRCELYSNGKKIERFFNNRGFEVKVIESDINTNVSYEKDVVFDGRGNILKIYFDKVLFLEYEYLPSGLIKSYTVWNLQTENAKTTKHGVKTIFDYDSRGWILRKQKNLIKQNETDETSFVNKSIVEFENSYEKSGTNFVVKNKISPTYYKIFTYDKYKNLTCEEHSNGYKEIKTFSKAGRLLSSINSNNTICTYNYKSNGTYSKNLKFKTGTSIYYDYDENGNLIYYKDFDGNISRWTYNAKNNLLKSENPNGTFFFEYDDFGRITSSSFEDLFGNVIQHTKTVYEKNKVTEYFGDYISSISQLDSWGRIIKSQNQNGTTDFSYNVLGLLVSKKNENNAEVVFEYDAFGNVIYENNFYGLEKEYFYDLKNNLISVNENEKQRFCLKYDDFGDILSVKDFFGNETKFSYNDLGNLIQISNFDTGKYDFSYEKNKSTFSIKDSLSNEWKIKSAENGKIAQSINPLNYKQNYEYFENGKIKSQEKFSGQKDNFLYDIKENSTLVTNNSGKTKIKSNIFNQITSYEDSFSNMQLEYDKGGRLKKQKDFVTNFEIDYSYDDFGRLKNKKSSLFDIEYEYNVFGFLNKISEKQSGQNISIFYDDLNREIKILFSNGTISQKSYNENGQIDSIIVKDKIGQILFSQFLLYDKNNRLEVICNHKGQFRQYEYDKNGKFISQIVEFSNEVYEKAKEDFIFSGGFEPNYEINGISCSLNQNQKDELQKIFNKTNIEVYLPTYQYSWKTEYEYTLTGSVLSETTKFGKIIYEYDALNRLTQKHTESTNENGINFVWNSNNCLESETCSYYSKSYKYNENLRPTQIKTVDYKNETSNTVFYDYDAFGRRIFESSDGENYFAYIYDGFSDNFSSIIPVFYNRRANLYTEENQSQYSETEFRVLKEKSYLTNDVKGFELSVSKKDDSYPTTFLNFDERNFIKIQKIENSDFENYFCFYDYKNDFFGLSDSVGNFSNCYSNDIWNPNKNFSKREYSYSMKSFTSMDPAFDKGNLFAYCSCDPVNYKDSNGLEKKGRTTAQNARAYSEYAKILLFDKNEYHKTGNWNGIQSNFDCMDVSVCVNMICERNAGLGYSSELVSNFAEHYDSGDYKGAASSVCSRDMFSSSYENVATKTSSGYDRNSLRVLKDSSDSYSESYYRTNLKYKESAEAKLMDANTISPGTVLVWKKSAYKTNSDSGNWKGHTLTVLTRTFDANGNVTGFTYIEGHTDGGKTEIGYMTIGENNRGLDCLNYWAGVYMGAYELQDSFSYIEGIKKDALSKMQGCIK